MSADVDYKPELCASSDLLLREQKNMFYGDFHSYGFMTIFKRFYGEWASYLCYTYVAERKTANKI